MLHPLLSHGHLLQFRVLHERTKFPATSLALNIIHHLLLILVTLVGITKVLVSPEHPKT